MCSKQIGTLLRKPSGRIRVLGPNSELIWQHLLERYSLYVTHGKVAAVHIQADQLARGGFGIVSGVFLIRLAESVPQKIPCSLPIFLIRQWKDRLWRMANHQLPSGRQEAA